VREGLVLRGVRTTVVSRLPGLLSGLTRFNTRLRRRLIVPFAALFARVAAVAWRSSLRRPRSFIRAPCLGSLLKRVRTIGARRATVLDVALQSSARGALTTTTTATTAASATTATTAFTALATFRSSLCRLVRTVVGLPEITRSAFQVLIVRRTLHRGSLADGWARGTADYLVSAT
jgi:hypothetical protein